jgi:hypothetical protein
VNQARETLAKDTIDLGRDRQLSEKGYIAEQTYRDQITTVRNDQQALTAAQAALASARSNVAANGTLGSNGLQSSSIEQAKAQEQAALAQAHQERVQIAKAAIYSPIDGVVVNRNSQSRRVPGLASDLHAAAGRSDLRDPARLGKSDRGHHGRLARRRDGLRSARRQTLGNGRRRAQSDRPRFDRLSSQGRDGQPRLAAAPGHGRRRPDRAAPVRGVRVPATAFTDDNHTQLLAVTATARSATVKVRESRRGQLRARSSRALRRHARYSRRTNQRRRRTEGRDSMSLTRLFIKRPTLVFVWCR